MIAQISPPVIPYQPGSFGGRTFGCCSSWPSGTHLGEDIKKNALDPIRSIADGKILQGNASGAHCNYGMVVVIEHELPSGWAFEDGNTKFVSIYGHLSNRTGYKPKLSGSVKRGEVIGYVGHDGGLPPKSTCSNDDENGDGIEHLHLGIRIGDAPKDQNGDPIWVYYGYYKSTQPFEKPDYLDNGTYIGGHFTSFTRLLLWWKEQEKLRSNNSFGDPIQNERLNWYFNSSNQDSRDIKILPQTNMEKFQGISQNVFTQHYLGKDCIGYTLPNGKKCDGVTVYDANGGSKTAYIVGWQQWTGWNLNSNNEGWETVGGPRSERGNPITNSYWYPLGTLEYPHGCWRQDFQMGWLCYEKWYDYKTVSPGIYTSNNTIFSDNRRWDPTTSYAFAEAYERNGGAVTLGSAHNDNNNSIYVHDWTIIKNSNEYKVRLQNFNEGTFGESAIIYNLNDGNAYVVRTGFWDFYRFNEGTYILGVPIEDEKISTIGGLNPSIKAWQNFEKGYLIWDGNTVKAYNNDDAPISTTSTTAYLHNFPSLIASAKFIATYYNIPESNTIPEDQFGGTIPTPDNLTAQATPTGGISLSYVLPSLNTTDYQIVVYRNGVSTSTIPAEISNFTDTGLQIGVQYCYTVSIRITSLGESEPSNQSCATTLLSNIINIPTTSAYSIKRSIVTADTIFHTTDYQPTIGKTTVTRQEGFLYSWLELENVTKPMKIEWRWFDPSGVEKKYYLNNIPDPKSSGYDYWNWYDQWDIIDLKNLTPDGQWKIDIYIDGQKAITQYFNLIADYSINRSLISTDTILHTDNYQPSIETTTVDNQDGYIYSWLELGMITKPLKIEWRWFDPSGAEKKYYLDSIPDPKLSGYDYWGGYNLWDIIDSKNLTPEGQWKTDIYIDGQKVVSQYFNFTIPTDNTVPETPPTSPLVTSPSASALPTITICDPPAFGDWIVTESCTLTEDYIAPGSIILQEGAVIALNYRVNLTIDLAHYKLDRKHNSGIYYKYGSLRFKR